MHVTLRSSQAKGPRSFLATHQRRVRIEQKIRELARRFGVRICKLAIVGNHIHLLLKATYRRGLISFLRAITGIIARTVLGAERGQPKLASAGRFWDQRPWTRVIPWLKNFANVKNYVELNFAEAMGFIPYRPRKYRSTA